jgi:DNA-binding Lrp family transcriptional regulator
VESLQLDPTDRRILRALVMDPRASFRTLAAAGGVSDQTAGRRFRRLEDVIGLRVLGRVDPHRVGWADWYLRMECLPGAAIALAEALARRSDTRWVVLASGGTEIVCALQVRTPRQRDALLLEGLPGSRRVTRLIAQSLLHDYSAPAAAVLVGSLTERERAELRRPSTPERDATVALSADDEKLLQRLAHDGRESSSNVAAALGWNESRVRRRINELRRGGVLVFDIDVDGEALGMRTQALLWASVEPAHLDAAGRAMAGHPEVPFVAATTGPTNLMATVVCPYPSDLYTYITHRFASLPGIRNIESTPLIRTVKRAGPSLDIGAPD